MADLTATLQAFSDFLRIDDDLLTVAAQRSPKLEVPSPERGIEEWIAALPERMKTDWLVRLAGGGESRLRAELLRRFRESRPVHPPRNGGGAPRTVGELLEGAERLSEERRRKAAKRAAAELTRRERREAEARARYLTDLAKREI